MFIPENYNLEPLTHKIWRPSPMIHGSELEYVEEAYETNRMSMVGKNINEIERIAVEKVGVKYAVGLSCYTAALHFCVRLDGERLYGKLDISHGAVESKRAIAI